MSGFLFVSFIACLLFCLTYSENPNKTYQIERLEKRYECLRLAEALGQELDSTPLSLSSYLSLINSLENPSDAHAALALRGVTVTLESGLTYDLWKSLLYGCTIGKENDNILQRIFRLGMIESAQMLQSSVLFDAAQYIWSIDARRENLMHLAVRTANPEMVRILGGILQDQVIHLLVGDFAKNDAGLLPFELANQLGHYGSANACNELSDASKGFSPPPLPEQPTYVELPKIDVTVKAYGKTNNYNSRNPVVPPPAPILSPPSFHNKKSVPRKAWFKKAD